MTTGQAVQSPVCPGVGKLSGDYKLSGKEYQCFSENSDKLLTLGVFVQAVIFLLNLIAIGTEIIRDRHK